MDKDSVSSEVKWLLRLITAFAIIGGGASMAGTEGSTRDAVIRLEVQVEKLEQGFDVLARDIRKHNENHGD